MTVKVLIVLNRAWNLYNFRAGLIRALDQQGYEVVVAAPPDEYAQRLPALGCRFVPLAMANHGMSVWGELGLMHRFWRLLRAERPAVYLGYTIKPNTYGSALASFMGMRVINNISGLGTAFLQRGWLQRVVCWMYRWGLGGSRRVFFQNADDRDTFVQKGLVRLVQTGLLPGSGVDLQRFFVSEPRVTERQQQTPMGFLLAGRLLLDKGVLEYVEAARQVRRVHPDVRFGLLGFLDRDNPRAVSLGQIQAWEREGVLTYLGETDDVRPYLDAVQCVVLPSYREGTPRTLLEAAAMGCPLIATDVPGCREVVDDGVNGYLCPPRDAASLADRMLQFLALPIQVRSDMGMAGRALVQARFDERLVIDAYLCEITNLVA
jgi:glycosyltransferase involved in cell wall biosynthesis